MPAPVTSAVGFPAVGRGSSKAKVQCGRRHSTHMIQSDILSRLSHLNTEISDNKDQILLPDHWFINSIDVSLQDRIKACTDIDPIVRDALAAIRKGSLPPM